MAWIPRHTERAPTAQLVANLILEGKPTVFLPSTILSLRGVAPAWQSHASRLFLHPLQNYGSNFRRTLAVNAVTDAGIEVQRALRDRFFHDVRIRDRCHFVVFTPEKIGGKTDL